MRRKRRVRRQTSDVRSQRSEGSADTLVRWLSVLSSSFLVGSSSSILGLLHGQGVTASCRLNPRSFSPPRSPRRTEGSTGGNGGNGVRTWKAQACAWSPIESPPEIAKTAKPSFAVIRCHSGSHLRGKPSPIRPPPRLERRREKVEQVFNLFLVLRSQPSRLGSRSMKRIAKHDAMSIIAVHERLLHSRWRAASKTKCIHFGIRSTGCFFWTSPACH